METEEKIDTEPVVVSKSKRIWSVILDIVLFTVGFILLMNLAVLISFIFSETSSEGESPSLFLLIQNQVLMLVSVCVSAWLVLKYRNLPFSRLGLSWAGCGKSLLYGALFVILLYVVGFGLSLLLGVVEVTSVIFSPASLLLNLLFFFLVAVSEELLGRGFILGRMLDEGIHKYVALFISAMLFSLMHLFNPNFALVPFLNILLAGIFLGASYIYTRNLSFPIALHWFWNWIQGPVLGYKVSGNEFSSESLLVLHLPEENLINGGTFGFEGSILCSFLLILGTILIL
ncbi:type II CAAX endopeptidase family protein, partial [uncultured Bacteroides sp.]|uniref:CPBP family intramembrane glutamic endopeptidase n=1 Tax=uncultured Bacteroides sp. TaxID=162156 RepID=UPI00261EDC58